MTPAERLRRLENLDRLDVSLLLAWLDGRAPEYVDEWFTIWGPERKPGLPIATRSAGS